MLIFMAGLLISVPPQSTAMMAPIPVPQERVPDNLFWARMEIGARPFAVVTSSSAEGSFSVAFKRGYDQVDGTYYVAMVRDGDNGFVEADSRECDFADELISLRRLELPELRVPGSLPHQRLPQPQFQHIMWTVNAYQAVQSDDQEANVIMSASHGPIAAWAYTLFMKASKCFPSS